MGSMEEPPPNGYFYKTARTNSSYFTVESAKGIYLNLANGQKILDGTCGAAVASIGHGDDRVKKAMIAQMDKVSYCHPGFFKTDVAQELAQLLVDSTEGKMARAAITGSGSEAMEGALKLARQYHLEKNSQSSRHRFIARDGSWHGSTLSTLAVGDFKGRKHFYEPLLSNNVSRVSACHTYRGMRKGEIEEAYVDRLVQEVDDEFQRVGPENVCAFVAEPLAGSALGCAPALPTYFEKIRSLTQKYGALLIFDEVMCGLGRTGTYHAWQAENCVPDIQAVGKVLGSGYAPVSALIVGFDVIETLKNGSGFFEHGQTFSSFPMSCAAALEVQKIIQRDGLVENVAKMGKLLEDGLKERLGKHPYVGDIRGKGLFWSIEFVADKTSKEPFESKLGVSKRVGQKGFTPGFDISLFPVSGAADGWRGDHIMVMPPFVITAEDVKEIVDRVGRVVEGVFEDMEKEGLLQKKAVVANGTVEEKQGVEMDGPAADGGVKEIPGVKVAA